jgi:hypothetical protein
MNKTQQRPEADPAKDFSRFEGSKESAAFAFDAHGFLNENDVFFRQLGDSLFGHHSFFLEVSFFEGDAFNGCADALAERWKTIDQTTPKYGEGPQKGPRIPPTFRVGVVSLKAAKDEDLALCLRRNKEGSPLERFILHDKAASAFFVPNEPAIAGDRTEETAFKELRSVFKDAPAIAKRMTKGLCVSFTEGTFLGFDFFEPLLPLADTWRRGFENPLFVRMRNGTTFDALLAYFLKKKIPLSHLGGKRVSEEFDACLCLLSAPYFDEFVGYLEGNASRLSIAKKRILKRDVFGPLSRNEAPRETVPPFHQEAQDFRRNHSVEEKSKRILALL